MDKNMELLRNQILDSAANVKYTYISHWNIVSRLKTRFMRIKIIQIILTAFSTCGVLASIVAGIPQLGWISGVTSAISLCLNLYVLNFDLPRMIQLHNDAANELWHVRARFESLIVDFETMDISDIRNTRDELIIAIDSINKAYPGTDEKSFTKAQKDIDKYTFKDGEAKRLMHISSKNK